MHGIFSSGDRKARANEETDEGEDGGQSYHGHERQRHSGTWNIKDTSGDEEHANPVLGRKTLAAILSAGPKSPRRTSGNFHDFRTSRNRGCLGDFGDRSRDHLAGWILGYEFQTLG